MLSLLLLAAAARTCALRQDVPADELYAQLHGVNPTGNPPGAGPDPLFSYTWDASVNVTAMQRYEANATAALATPPACMPDAPSLLLPPFRATFSHFGALRLDFGVERAAWFEFFSPDLAAILSLGNATVKASISEYSEPWTGKTKPVTVYDGGLFRLETNTPELYEGVRFAWIMYERSAGGVAAAAPWTLLSPRLQAQVKPLNYTGHFESSDPVLTAVWRAGALGSRLNAHEQYYGSILMDRGDRVSIQGDGHPTMAAALAAFASPEVHRLGHVMLRATDSGCKGCKVVDSGIMSYPVLWTLSTRDWLWSSGEGTTFLADFADDAATILDSATRSFLTNPGLSLMGWDDRLGNGWCWEPFPCGREPQLTFAALLLMAVQQFALALGAAGDAQRAAQYNASAAAMVKALAAAVPLDDGTLGVHSASGLLSVQGLANPHDVQGLLSTYLNDSGLGNAGALDRASDMAALCWGGMTRLGNGCFWELFSPMWEGLVPPAGKAPTRPSYCHPWSNGVTAWLTHALGGINAAAPGFGGRGYILTPHTSLRHASVRSTAATPEGGSISVAARRASSGGRTVSVTALTTPGVVGLPRWDDSEGEGGPSCGALQRMLVNGVEVQPAPLTSQHLGGALHYRASLPRTHLFTPLLPPGQHTVVGEYAGSRECGARQQQHQQQQLSAFPPASWAAVAWGLDTATQGRWQGAKGADGHYFFSFYTNSSGAAQDLPALPPYAHSVRIKQAGFDHTQRVCLGANASDPAFLQDPRPSAPAAALPRLGYASTGGDGSQGIAIDVNLTSAHGVLRSLSFYMASTQQPTAAVDPYQAGQPSMVVRVMDLRTLNPIAPDLRIDDFGAGVYYNVTICCGCAPGDGAWCGVRARLMQIDGTNSISAVFFDSPAA